MSFSPLGLDAKILQAVQEAGYTEPTPIQVAAIPPIIAGHDLIGSSGAPDQTALPLGSLATLDTTDGTLTVDPVVC